MHSNISPLVTPSLTEAKASTCVPDRYREATASVAWPLPPTADYLEAGTQWMEDDKNLHSLSGIALLPRLPCEKGWQYLNLFCPRHERMLAFCFLPNKDEDFE